MKTGAIVLAALVSGCALATGGPRAAAPAEPVSALALSRSAPDVHPPTNQAGAAPAPAPALSSSSTPALTSESAKGPVSAFALTLKFVGDRPPGACEFFLQDVASKTRFSAQLDPKKTSVVFDIPAGRYSPVELKCGPDHDIDLANWRDEFRVRAATLSYGGLVEVTALAGPAPSFGLKVGAREERAALRALFNIPEAKSGLVSSWTGKAITRPMLRQRRYSGLDYLWKSATAVGDHQVLNEKMHACELAEIGRNRVLLGRFRLTAIYLKGKMTNTLIGSSKNTYSDELVDCLRAGLDGFAVPSSEPVSITISL